MDGPNPHGDGWYVMRMMRNWRRTGKAVAAGSVTVGCVVLTALPAQAAAASQARAMTAAAAAPICRAWLHNGQKRTKLASTLAADITSALHSRGDRYAVAVLDEHLGVSCGLHAKQHFESASVVKATILAALLRKRQAQHRSLTTKEKSLATLMITQSDNSAATALWNDVGRTSLQKFLNLAGMTETVLGPGGYWGVTQLTAHDEQLLLWLLMRPNSVLSLANRHYELTLMADVIASQRWGTPAGAPAGFKVHVKNGWAPLNAPDWNVNSIGCFTHLTDNYSIVVLTDGNPDMAYGVTTIENVAVKIHHDLNGTLAAAVPRSTPNRSWTTPDEPLPPPGV
jgi:Beta-lactamase enzyme family